MLNVFSHLQKVKSLLFIIKRNLYQNHYEVLNIQRNATQKEIKDAYIILSKKYHPDSNEGNEKKFVQISEAYSTLIKPSSRINYDLGLSTVRPSMNHDAPPSNYVIRKNPWDDPSFYKNRDKTQDAFYESQAYYGIKGVNRISNFSIVLLCLIVMFIGVTLQMITIRKSITFKRDRIIAKSNEAQNHLNEIQRQVEMNGNQAQIEILRRKLRDVSRKLD